MAFTNYFEDEEIVKVVHGEIEFCDLTLWPSDTASNNFIENKKPKCFGTENQVKGNRISESSEVMVI